MDDDISSSNRMRCAILLVVHQEDFLRGLGQVVVAAVQGVVKSLGDFEEVVAAGDDVPVRAELRARQAAAPGG